MMAATLPFAPSVVVSPGALPTHRELRRIIAALEQKVYTLQIEVAQNEANAMYVTDAMRGALTECRRRIIQLTGYNAKLVRSQPCLYSTAVADN